MLILLHFEHLNFICDIELFFFFTMSVIREGNSTPRGLGRGRGVLSSPMFLQFETPVHRRGIVLGGSEGTPWFPLISREVSPPLSHPVGISNEPQHTSSAAPSPVALVNEIVNQMGDQHVTQKVVQNIITQFCGYPFNQCCHFLSQC